jgi:hypothetical protein
MVHSLRTRLGLGTCMHVACTNVLQLHVLLEQRRNWFHDVQGLLAVEGGDAQDDI